MTTLGKADPHQDGHDVKVADVLDRLRADLDTGLKGSTALRVALLDALGRVYLGLGLYPEAAGVYERLPAEQREHPGFRPARRAQGPGPPCRRLQQFAARGRRPCR